MLLAEAGPLVQEILHGYAANSRSKTKSFILNRVISPTMMDTHWELGESKLICSGVIGQTRFINVDTIFKVEYFVRCHGRYSM